MAENEVVVRIRAQDAGAMKALGALMRALDQSSRTTGVITSEFKKANVKLIRRIESSFGQP